MSFHGHQNGGETVTMRELSFLIYKPLKSFPLQGVSFEELVLVR